MEFLVTSGKWGIITDNVLAYILKDCWPSYRIENYENRD